MSFLFWWLELLVKFMFCIIIILVIIIFFISLFKSLYYVVVHKQNFLDTFLSDFKRRLIKVFNIIF